MSTGWPSDGGASPGIGEAGRGDLIEAGGRARGGGAQGGHRARAGQRDGAPGARSDTPPDPASDAAGQLPPGDPEQVARLILLRRLESAPRTRAELARTLRERGIPDEVAERVLDRFVEVGLIDDPLFAQMWVQSRQAGRLLSRRALRQELVRRGVDAETIEAAVVEVSDEQERHAARQLAERRARSTVGLAHQVRVRRLAGALARRGYASGLVHAVVLEVLEEEGTGAAD